VLTVACSQRCQCFIIGSSSGSSSGSEDEEDQRRVDSKKPKFSFGMGKKPDLTSKQQAAAKVKSIQIKLGGLVWFNHNTLV